MIVDERGRLFGRINLFDAAIAAVVLLLIPLAFVSYRVFRTPTPELDRVEPAVQVWQPERLRVRLHGRNLRPYLRAFVNRTGEPFSVNNQDPRVSLAIFLAVTPQLVELQLPPIPPGTYDLYLYDAAEELIRAPRAIELTLPQAQATLSVRLRAAVAPEIAALIARGDEDRVPAGAADAGLPNAAVTDVVVRPDAQSGIELLRSPDGRAWAGGTTAARSLELTLRVPVTRSGLQWRYKDQRVLAGEMLTFETDRYVLRGTIIAVGETPAAAAGARQ